ncbi:hypothetical protein [Thermogutta sp.]|uniref:hypothetical protein n=1 Tax=Thermogutta sp. TaxID=1962930 RepID=UPI0032203A0A
MAILEEVRVERVDGVEDPATGRGFLLLKSEEPDELRRNAEQAFQLMVQALEALHKSTPTLEDEETVSALNEIAKVLGLSLEFECGSKKKPEMEYGYGYGYPNPPKPTKKAEVEAETTEVEESKTPTLTVDDIKRAVAEAIEEKLNTPRQVAKSNQAPEPIKRELGRGLFTNIVFGR